MRKLATPLIIALMAVTLVFAPACDVEIDWQDIAKQAVAEWVGSAVITGIDKYVGDKDAVVAWVLDKANDVEFIEPYLEYVNLQAMVERAWDMIWPNIYDAARWAGMDVDADGPNDEYSWHVTPSNPCFDGLVDELADMI